MHDHVEHIKDEPPANAGDDVAARVKRTAAAWNSPAAVFAAPAPGSRLELANPLIPLLRDLPPGAVLRIEVRVPGKDS